MVLTEKTPAFGPRRESGAVQQVSTMASWRESTGRALREFPQEGAARIGRVCVREELLQVGEPVAVVIFSRIRGVCGIETVGAFPAVAD